MITASRLEYLLNYDALTGLFHWKRNKARAKRGSVVGRLRSDGYIGIKIDRQSYMAHRLAWVWMFGSWPNEIDHINRNRSDNRIDNLRDCTRSLNFANRSAKLGRELPKGVRLDTRSGRYVARITVNRCEMALGAYNTAAEAQVAYLAAARKYFGEFASSGEIVVADRQR